MIKFMVIGYPRSGTAWAANWLSTEFSLCLHDPLLHHRYPDWDQIPCDRRLGVSCTAIARLPDFLNSHPAPKVILHRDFEEVQTSLAEAHLPALLPQWRDALRAVNGLHVPWQNLFTNPRPIWEHLLPGQAFDAQRHKLLQSLNVQAALEKATPSREAVQHYMRAIHEAAR